MLRHMGSFDYGMLHMPTQDDRVKEHDDSVINVMSTGAMRNGDIPTIWIIVRDFSASFVSLTTVEMTKRCFALGDFSTTAEMTN